MGEYPLQGDFGLVSMPLILTDEIDRGVKKLTWKGPLPRPMAIATADLGIQGLGP
jgi:hypothetical protein